MHDESTRHRLRTLPALRAPGQAQMAVDAGMLTSARFIVARRYRWNPPTLSLGKFQKIAPIENLPFDVVRRPSGGRAVLHGAAFEWSFAVAFPAGSLPRRGPSAAYELVSGAWAEALRSRGVRLDESRETPYQRSGLCFASSLRHDLMVDGEKVIAVAQAQHDGAALVHGSVLERRPPESLTGAVEDLLQEPWQGRGLAVTGLSIPANELWPVFFAELASVLEESGAARDNGPSTSSEPAPIATARRPRVLTEVHQ